MNPYPAPEAFEDRVEASGNRPRIAGPSPIPGGVANGQPSAAVLARLPDASGAIRFVQGLPR